jgi:hypothetical protein
MSRLLAALGCLAAISAVLAAPVPTHLMPKDPPFTFPTRVGTKWVYEGNSGKRTIEITEVKEEDGAALVTTERVEEDGTRTPYMLTRVSAAGVFLVAERGTKYIRPWCMFKRPHRQGQTWETRWCFEGGLADTVGQMTAGPVEKVKVGAAEFSAARVEWNFNGGPSKVTYWYADGVGLVKMDETLVLKSFTLGKE